ncbi:M13 family metallopeptidase [Streptococcus merionis]|uniref:M13 family metallopeptidase n=1 Tax=Streptococcus merionis TaxID=400065 RepID=UPI0026EE8F7E|nr:M13 family metallopeptidase [Streptococcus merionis]
MKTRKIAKLMALLVSSGALLLTACQSGQSTSVDKNATVSSNFYQAINKEWLEKAEIPSDMPATDAFSEVQESIDDALKSDLAQLASGEKSSDVEGVPEMLQFYQLVNDFDRREKEGLEPVKAYMDQLKNLKSLEDLVSKVPDMVLQNTTLPFALGVGQDLEDTSSRIIELSSPSTILPDVSYYDDKETKEQVLDLYKSTSLKVLSLMGYKEKEAEKMIDQAIAFDALLVPYVPSSEELADIESQHNIRTASDLKAYSKTIDFASLANGLVGQELDRFNVGTPAYFEHFDEIVNEDNFELLKSWIMVNELLSSASYLTEELRLASAEYSLALNGIQEAPAKEEAAYQMTMRLYSDVMSVYYGQNYFGNEAKEDVTGMIENIIEIYRERLSKNDWLSKETVEKAIEKLNAMTYYVGYPEDVSEEIHLMTVDESKSLFENLMALTKRSMQESFKDFSEPIDKTEWFAESFVINAFYDPTSNSIVFPAAILQAPMYSKDQTMEENMGGIGAVIGHEITHAFDDNGALFDKEGNLNNWWTKKDFAAFEEKTQAVIDQWDVIEIYGSKVNGALTVGENIADAGGLSASLEALQTAKSDADLTKFFESWAKVWRIKATEEYSRLLLLDTHAPNELRVNVQLKNMDAFYETYDIKEGDNMYLPPKDRVSVW